VTVFTYLEWSLFFIIFVSETVSIWFFNSPRLPLFNIFILGVLTTTKSLIKIDKNSKHWYLIYLLETLLVTLASLQGGIRLFPLLFILLVVRHSWLATNKQKILMFFTVITLFIYTIIYRVQSIQMAQIIVKQEYLIIYCIVVIILFSIIILFFEMLVAAIQAEKEIRYKLYSANKKLQEYALKVEDMATLAERNRIAREIHDSLGHSLTALNLHLEAATRILPYAPEEATELLSEAKQLVKSALQQVRQSVSSLRCDPLVEKSLTEALAGLLKDFKRSTGISPISKINLNDSLPDELNLIVYRIVQEALTNISKYAQATKIVVEINSTEELELSIKDNGKGFNLKDNISGFGLQGMKERTEAQGGKLKIITSPGNGCEILVNIPR